ncbi:MAG: hypothetical protein KKC64_13635 [Spirochaetes bacterium]|nr:hypothetical protein [Spirochaetota bacterium]
MADRENVILKEAVHKLIAEIRRNPDTLFTAKIGLTAMCGLVGLKVGELFGSIMYRLFF